MLAGMSDEVSFASDLYRGTALHYDRFRLPYPEDLIADLVRRTRPAGRGRLLDLACGTGQLAFALSDRFEQVWAVDQEPDKYVECVQPEDDGQMIWTHILNSHTTNQLIASGLWYSALFGPPNIQAALAKFPTTLDGDRTTSTIGAVIVFEVDVGNLVWPGHGRDY